MRREGRVRGKPTSKSRVTGRCRNGKTRCRNCRDHPVEKSRAKRMGRYKRLAVDVRTNPALADFALQPSFRHLPLRCLDLEERLWAADDLDLGGDQSYDGVVCGFCELGCGAEDSQSSMCEEPDFGTVELALQLSDVSMLSDGSWSDIALTESDEETSDWSVVDVNEDGARE